MLVQVTVIAMGKLLIRGLGLILMEEHAHVLFVFLL
jgi:hypothetical protein